MKLKDLSRLALLAALVTTGAALRTHAQNKKTPRPEEQSVGAAGHAASSETKARAGATRYIYEFTNPAFFVTRIRLMHDSTGRGRITFERKYTDGPITEPLTLSPAALQRILTHWEALHFLDSNASYQHEKQFPHLGTVRLTMNDGARERTAEFNYSGDPDAFALATEYRRAADQAMIVFDINLALENQPLESPKLLEQLDRMVARDAVSDAAQLTPLLRSLSTDERLPLIARNRAAKILKRIEEVKK